MSENDDIKQLVATLCSEDAGEVLLAAIDAAEELERLSRALDEMTKDRDDLKAVREVELEHVAMSRQEKDAATIAGLEAQLEAAVDLVTRSTPSGWVGAGWAAAVPFDHRSTERLDSAQESTKAWERDASAFVRAASKVLGR